ncbi:hypothetical protein AAVH_34498, partial [Aphelenchoides avenae]
MGKSLLLCALLCLLVGTPADAFCPGGCTPGQICVCGQGGCFCTSRGNRHCPGGCEPPTYCRCKQEGCDCAAPGSLPECAGGCPPQEICDCYNNGCGCVKS